MIGATKRLITGGLPALALVGGGLGFGGEEAAAYTKTHRSDDGKLVLICHYDDRTHGVAFCDVYWFPLHVAQGGAVAAR